MNGGCFKGFAADENHPLWEELTRRKSALYERGDDIRSPFARDYTRLLHSTAYRRLKHKTQVFYNIENDHICTRIEHVAHVESVSSTIAARLGLNGELTRAISIGHDIGHAPFGHQGEKVLRELSQKYLKENFWHERNGLRFADKIELLADNYNVMRNLDLTYAVRDGIISHCGEVDENGVFPREELIDLEDFSAPGEYQPATWEGLVVKISDKIAYIGRDIEDAVSLGFLSRADRAELLKMARANDENVLNTTVIMHNMIIDLCENSTPEGGMGFSPAFFEQIKELKAFNYERIYSHPRLAPFARYSDMVLRELFNVLYACFDGKHTWAALSDISAHYPSLAGHFERHLARLSDESIVPDKMKELALLCDNEKIYGCLEDEKTYVAAILDFLSGMTDRFAIKDYEELLKY